MSLKTNENKSKSAYYYFCKKNREDIKKQVPDSSSIQIMYILKDAWKSLNAEQKIYYQKT